MVACGFSSSPSTNGNPESLRSLGFDGLRALPGASPAGASSRILCAIASSLNCQLGGTEETWRSLQIVQTFYRTFQILRFNFNADRIAARGGRSNGGRPCTEEGVEHRVA